MFFRNTEALGEWLKFMPEWAYVITTEKLVVITVHFDESIEINSFLAGFLATAWPYERVGPTFSGRSLEEVKAGILKWAAEDRQ